MHEKMYFGANKSPNTKFKQCCDNAHTDTHTRLSARPGEAPEGN